jgi:hypothetical protein
MLVADNFGNPFYGWGCRLQGKDIFCDLCYLSSQPTLIERGDAVYKAPAGEGFSRNILLKHHMDLTNEEG